MLIYCYHINCFFYKGDNVTMLVLKLKSYS